MAGASLNENDDTGLMTSINITPFVDVVLVLLVIFMVTAPLLTKDLLDLHLPKAATSDLNASASLGIAVNKDGNILVNGHLVDDQGLRELAKTSLKDNPQIQALIAADQQVIYGKVVHVIDLLKSVGLEKFAVQIEKEKQP
jgi:biopolymer transport protein ExbD